MPRQGVSRPAYPLKEVKRLAMESQVLFRRRKDGKATPMNVGLTEAEACAVIARRKHMKCCDCGKEMRLLTGYTEDDNGVGPIKTDGEYWECTDPACGCKLVPAATVRKVDAIRAERTKKLLWDLVGSPEDMERLFISVKDVAAILGITRQAVEKSLVIKGLTYNIVVMGVRYWLRKSVELYKETGDGRFPLSMPTATDSHSNGWTTRTAKAHRKAAKATTSVLTPAD